MPEMLSPAVYPTEVDYSAYVRSLSTSAWGVVGVFQKGPVGEATLVRSLEEAKETFGSYLDATGYLAMHSLKNFFENGGARAYVVRTVHYVAGAKESEPATITLLDRHATTPVSTLKVDGKTDGTWAAGYKVEVTASVGLAATGFDIKVLSSADVVLETFKDLLIGSANVSSSDYVEKKINGVSAYIKVTDLLSATAAPLNRPAIAVSALAGGDDGLTSLAATDFVGTTGDNNGLYALDTVDVGFVSIPGEADATIGEELAAGLLTYCESRKDCVAIIDGVSGDNAVDTAAFRSGTAPYSHSAFNSSYGALYAPWQVCTHPESAQEITLPPSGFVAGVWARSDTVGNVWDAPAGLERGVLRGVLRPEKSFSKSDADVLYEAGVNPIRPVQGSLVVYGQKTLQLKASALDRINVRRLMAHIEKAVTASAEFLVFKANDKKTWEEFKRLVNPFLQRVKDGRGVYDYLIICDETLNTAAVIDQNIMKARVLVKPTKTAEFISIEFAIAPSGANFSEL